MPTINKYRKNRRGKVTATKSVKLILKTPARIVIGSPMIGSQESSNDQFPQRCVI